MVTEGLPVVLVRRMSAPIPVRAVPRVAHARPSRARSHGLLLVAGQREVDAVKRHAHVRSRAGAILGHGARRHGPAGADVRRSRMKTSLRVLALVACLPAFGAAYLACSDTPGSTDAGQPPSPTATTTTTTTAPPTTTTTTVDATAPVDAAPPMDAGEAGCAYPKPVMDGGGLCGTYPFGAAAVTFVMPDAGPPAYDGGVLPPGIYDVVLGERASSLSAGWRETFVVDGARFTSIQQRSIASSTLALTQRSGTYTLTGGELKLTYDCAFSDDAGVEAGAETYPFTVSGAGCDRDLRWSAPGNIHLTLKRRP